MLDDYSISRRNEILQTLCEFLSESHAFARFQSSSPFFGYFATPGSTDIFCIGAIFGCVSFIENKAIREETKVLTGSDAFGCALSCAILSGNVEMVEFLINPKTVPYVPVDKRDIENVIASQNLRMLELLLKAWIGIKIKVKDGKGQLYLQQVDNFVNKAIDVGNAEMTQCILSCTDQNVVAKIRLNTRNERAINKRRAIRDQKAQISDWKNTCCMWRTSEYTH
jgi:hypothetical protein